MPLPLRWWRPRPSTAAVIRRFIQTESCHLENEDEVENAGKKIKRIVNVAIIGAPNAGKSTLINNVVGRKVCAASKKVHTTKSLARAMCVIGDTQVVFLDTPGVITEREKKRYNLPSSMEQSYEKGLRIADVVGVLHDVMSTKGRESLHWDVACTLQEMEGVPSFLVLNKVDMMKEKKPLLTMIRVLTNGMVGGQPIPGPAVRPARDPKRPRGYSHFSDVFMVSALRGDGVADIREYLIANAKPARQHYAESQVTDQKPEELIVNTVRAALLDFLPQEIPYNLVSTLEYYEDLDDKIVTSVVVTCPTARITRLVGGSGGGRINQIQSAAQLILADIFQKYVTLQLRLVSREKENVRPSET